MALRNWLQWVIVFQAVCSYEEDLGAASCVHWHRHGKILFYKDTAVLPIGISLPAANVRKRIPGKDYEVAGFVGSGAGGVVKEYKFNSMEEKKYLAMYSQHRFAVTRKKGGWDALRHVEILAAGSVPVFHGLRQAHQFAVPFLPQKAILDAETQLQPDEPWSPSDRSREAAYNATVHAMLAHTRRCLTSEAMAAYVLRELGLWPSTRPLSLLYITCGFGWTSARTDGWQGPVSIGLFLGLHLLLSRLPGSRIVDAPSMDPNPETWPQEGDERISYLWYVFHRPPGCQYREQDLRERMYGFGFSYAFKIPCSAMPSERERQRVPDALHKREFDAVIFGKVGPSQGCTPLPFIDDVLAAGYPPQRIALIYGGDFGLETKEIAAHARLFGGIGTIFFREMESPPSHFSWRSERILPKTCYMDYVWRSFFKLWKMRLDCWSCHDVDSAFESIWPALREAIAADLQSLTALDTADAMQDSKRGEMTVKERATQSCWSGAALALFPLVASTRPKEEKEQMERCVEAERVLKVFAKRIHLLPGSMAYLHKGAYVRWQQQKKAYAIDFFDEFGVYPEEVRALVCDACLPIRRSRYLRTMCKHRQTHHGDSSEMRSGNFSKGTPRFPLSALREQAKARMRARGYSVQVGEQKQDMIRVAR